MYVAIQWHPPTRNGVALAAPVSHEQKATVPHNDGISSHYTIRMSSFENTLTMKVSYVFMSLVVDSPRVGDWPWRLVSESWSARRSARQTTDPVLSTLRNMRT